MCYYLCHFHSAPDVDHLGPAEGSTWKKERMCNSAICIPTFVQEQEQQSFLQRTQFRASANFPSFHNAKNTACPNGNFPKSDNSTTTADSPSALPVTSVTNGDIFANVNSVCGSGSPTVKTNNNCNNNIEVNQHAPVMLNLGENSVNSNVVPDSTLNGDGLPSMEAAMDTNPLTSPTGSGTHLTTAIMISNLTTSMPSQPQNGIPTGFTNNARYGSVVVLSEVFKLLRL